MAMPVKDFRQLEKLMMMTTSDTDAEALAALRKANEILKRHGYNWTSTFQRLVKVQEAEIEEAPEEPNASDEKADIQYAFNVIGNHKSPFVRSLEEQFTERGSLSDRQRSALFEIAKKYR